MARKCFDSDREKALPSLPPYRPHVSAPPLHQPLRDHVPQSQYHDHLNGDSNPYYAVRSEPRDDLRRTTPSPPGGDEASLKPFTGCITYYERSEGPSTSEHKRHHHSVRHLLATWWLEGASILVMLACLAAIVATLRLHEDQPLPKWKGIYGFLQNINALLSIYYTVFKGAMLLVVQEGISQLKWAWFQKPRPLWDLERFDEASRGPKGAVQLLWASRRKLGSSWLPVLGSFLVIIALLIDPFTQQIVHYYNCSRRSSTMEASVARTNNFTTSSIALGMGGSGGTGNIKQDMGIQGAMYNGLFDSASTAPSFVPASCPTGNCTFDPYWSLGMCASVTDVTHRIEYSCRPYEWWNSFSQYGPSYSKDGPLCNYTLPPSQKQSYEVMDGVLLNTTPGPMIWTAYNMTLGTALYSKDHPGTVAWQAMRWSTPGKSLPFSDLGQSLPEEARGAGAAYAELYPCIRQYSGSVRGGTFEEHTLATVPFATCPSIGWPQFGEVGAITVRVPCLTDDERHLLKGAGHDLVMTDEWIALNTTDYARVAGQVNEQCVFSMVGEFLMYAPQIFANLWATGEHAAVVGPHQAVTFSPSGDLFTTMASTEAFYDFNNVTFASLTDRFTAIADALTSYMRRNPGNVGPTARAPAIGTVWTSDTCVGAEWRWILLPGMLLLSTAVFYIVVLAMLFRGGCQNWKSSSMALLYNGLETDLSRESSGNIDLRGMERSAKSLFVQLQKTDDGCRFVRSTELK